jgi:TolB-like protein/class 3 adenylate cyclase/Tfp pilus assembly protein PilF
MGWVEFPILGAFLAGERVERRLAAVLAADVAGYSRLMGLDEEGTLAQLKAVRKALVDPIIAVHRGRIVKTTGDGMLVEFASAVDAVRCAIEVQHDMAGQGADGRPHTRIELRIGIHVGDIIFDDNDIFGDGVNIAARLEGIAEPGGVCISDDTYRQIRDRVDAVFDDKGETALKNIARPVRVFALAGAQQPEIKVSEPAPPLALPDKPSIAVLPFQNMSGDPEQEYFADGMVDDIITGLSRIRWLFVIARNSSSTYKGRSVDVKQVGRDLGVRYVLEGGVRKAGNRIRITAQLIEATSGTHLWAERYDRSLDDIFAVQDEITISVVGAIEPSLRRAEIERVKRKRTDNLDAYDLVLRALPLVYVGEFDNANCAIPLLEQALALDPAYATAHAALAWCHHHLFSRGGMRQENREAAIQHAHAATAHGGDDATALAIAGLVFALDAHDNGTAFRLFDQALALSSSNVFALSCSALSLAWSGHPERAIERAQRALRLSPFDPMNFMPNCALAIAYLQGDRCEDARDAARQAVAINPRFSVCHAHLAAALERLGEHERAREAAQQVLTLNPGFTVTGFAAAHRPAPEVFACYAEAWREAGLPE